MERREDTPIRKARRNYEDRNKEWRKDKNKVWGTSINRSYAKEIDEFLAQHNLTKVELIGAGYETLKKTIKKE